MANAIEKVNTIAIASIEAVNGITDANLQALNGLEFTAGYVALSWASATSISVTTVDMCAGGTTSASLVFGGTAGGSLIGTSQEWNGSSWSGGGALSATRDTHGGGGTQTSAIACGGYIDDDVDTTEEYNGSTWSSGGTMQKGSYGPVTFGASITSHVWHGGKKYGDDAETFMDDTETYDGSTWSTSDNASVGMEGRSATFGVEGAGVKAGGNSSGAGAITVVETFDGSNWSTSSNTLGATRAWVSGFGLTGRGWVTGGYDEAAGARVSLATTETWDGTSFTADTVIPKNLARTSRGNYVGAGRAGFLVGGDEKDTSGGSSSPQSTHYQAS